MTDLEEYQVQFRLIQTQGVNSRDLRELVAMVYKLTRDAFIKTMDDEDVEFYTSTYIAHNVDQILGAKNLFDF